MEDQNNPVTTPKVPTVIDFGQYYNSLLTSGQGFNSAVVAQAFSDIKKQDPTAKMEFTEDAYKSLSEQLGQEEADKVKTAFTETLELSSIADQQELFAPMAIKNYENDLKGIKNFSSLAKNELKVDPVFKANSMYKPYQYRTFQEAAESNLNYMDENGEVKKLKDSEDYGDISNPWILGFGGSSLVVATNKFVAETNPNIAKAIEDGYLSPDAYYQDETGNHIYRKLREGEQNLDHVRSIFGPRTLYNQGLIRESAESFYDGLLGLIEGAGTVGYYGQKAISRPLSLLGFKNFDNHVNDQFNDFSNMVSRMKSAGSHEEDRGVLSSWTNFQKAVLNGVGQIVGTMGAGYAVGFGMKGLSALNSANKLGKISQLYAADLASGTTRALNFGIAAKAGKEESMRHGLSKDESDLMGLISGSIMLATEYMTGSQFIPKMAGKAGYSETTKKVTDYFIREAEKAGVKVGDFVMKNPQKFKEAVVKAHGWLESSARTRVQAFAKGFTGEAIQETSEDFGFSLAKEGYDMISGTHSFDQDWSDVMKDLAGSFLVGGFSGGLTRFATFKKSKENEDKVDEKRNNLIVNEIANGNYDNLKKAVEDAFINGQLGSKILSPNRDEKGNRVLASSDKNLDSRTENEFFRDVFMGQIEYAKQAYDDIKSKTASRQETADMMYELMGQKVFEGEIGLEELTKGLSTAIEIEGMQLFRMKSIREGSLALSMAKSKALSTSSKVHEIDQIRVVNGQVVAVKRKGDAEFSAPATDEKASIEMAYRELTDNTSSNFKAKWDQLSAQLFDLTVAKKNLETYVGRFNEPMKNSQIGLQKIAELEEVTKEEEQVSKDFEQFIKDSGYNPEIIEDAVQLKMMDRFTEELTNGKRSKRYGRNYRLNMAKASFPEVFSTHPDYNIEDYDSEKNGFGYFSETSADLIAESNEMSLQLDNDIKTFSATGNINLIIDVIENALKMDVRFKNETIQEIVQQIEAFKSTISETQGEEFDQNTRLIASLVKFVNEGQVLSNVIAMEGFEGLVFEDFTFEQAQEMMKNITLENMMELMNQVDTSEFIFEEGAVTMEDFQKLTDETIPAYFQQKQKFDTVSRITDILKRMQNVKRGELPTIDPVIGFVLNQNLKLKYNYSSADSIDAVLEKKINEYNAAPNEFIDNGTLVDLQKEIRKNQRYIIGRLIELVNKDEDSPAVSPEEMNSLKVGEAVLNEMLDKIDELLLASDRNRGDRFKRDYEVKVSYMESAVSNLQAIDKILSLDLSKRLDEINNSLVIKDDNRDEIDEAFEKLIEIEEEVSTAIQSLDKEKSRELISEVMSFNGIDEPGDYLFKAYNEDQKNPFNPDSERDQKENTFNYLNLLARGNVRDFFTLANEYIKKRDLKANFIPSQEQLLVSRSIYSFLTAGDKNAFQKELYDQFTGGTASFDENTFFVRGIAGAGKSSMVVNFAFEVLALQNKEVNNKLTTVSYTAPIEAQVKNIGKSFDEIMSTDIQASEFSITGNLDEIKSDFLVLDEATAFNFSMVKFYKKMRSDDKLSKKKMVLVGDELQKSDSSRPEPFIYSSNNNSGVPFFFERSTPLTTPYRSGKVDSFDLNGNLRDIIAELAKVQTTRKMGGFYQSAFVPRIELNTNTKLDDLISKTIDGMLKSKKTSFFQKNGVMEYGVKAYTTKDEVIKKFTDDYVKKGGAKNMVLITEDFEYAFDEVKKNLTMAGMNVSDSVIEEMVLESSQTQGLTFDHVYNAIELVENPSNLTEALANLQSFYVANSREKKSLVMVSPKNRITSTEVLSQSSIPAFSELNFKEIDPDTKELVGDSLALHENNLHISEVIGRLAGEMPKPKTQKVESSQQKQPDLSDKGVDENGNIVDFDEDGIDDDLTNPKSKGKMNQEDKSEADEAIKENQAREKAIRDEINNMSWEELDEIDPEDMFKGCSI